MPARRYHGVAIGLHWLMAILIVFMLGLGKYMTSLETTDPTRFSLTQLHKSIGVVLLLLVVWRLLWRLTHRPPSLHGTLEPWEITLAELTHWLLYLLLLTVPITGWIMVSASPLNLPTLLFHHLPWPHLPPFDSLSNKKEIAELFARIHDIAASIMILLVLGHIGAALRHQFVLRDDIVSRMSPTGADRKLVPGLGRFLAFITLLTLGLVVLANTLQRTPVMSAGDSDVSFVFTMFDAENTGIFESSQVELQYDAGNPAATTLSAIVQTASLNSGDMQVDSALPESDWFDVATHPEATFNSTSVQADDSGTLMISGTLSIKGISREISFPMTIQDDSGKQSASGGFTINRLDYDIGRTDQPDDSTVGYNVLIQFNFDLN
ncbi:MAG: cytochrome b/b6 domain-containing protein [Gammaproteobacteria bacterium]|nr:cytochrome b/b6 domain-containing protein [Gammaproteobacteria bacterium]